MESNKLNNNFLISLIPYNESALANESASFRSSGSNHQWRERRGHRTFDGL